jgi:hypothetical protein
MGHKDVATTQIYTHVLNRGAGGVVSPLDRCGESTAPYNALVLSVPTETGRCGSQPVLKPSLANAS